VAARLSARSGIVLKAHKKVQNEITPF